MTGPKLTVKHCGIDAGADYEELRKAMLLLFGSDEVVNRSLSQNDCFHPWMRKCAERWNDLGFSPRLTEESMKEILLLRFGNKRLIEGDSHGLGDFVIAMRTHRYKATPNDLTEAELRQGFISMQELMSEIEAWAARELSLNLETGEVYGEDAA